MGDSGQKDAFVYRDNDSAQSGRKGVAPGARNHPGVGVADDAAAIAARSRR
jgi:hypothetical protein